jgi:hypothetical protein
MWAIDSTSHIVRYCRAAGKARADIDEGACVIEGEDDGDDGCHTAAARGETFVYKSQQKKNNQRDEQEAASSRSTPQHIRRGGKKENCKQWLGGSATANPGWWR